MLTNEDIERICKKNKLPIIGVYSKNELKDLSVEVGSYYINLQDDDIINKDGSNGTHWTLVKVYCDDDKPYLKSLYFDSFGIGCPKIVNKFLEECKPIHCNNREIQNINSTECGLYCIACDYALENLRDSETYEEEYEKFLENFDDNPKKNLGILKRFIKKHID
jgi:hypothetical protein